jgi:hypothetical protein
MDIAKFYGLIAGLWYVLAAAAVRYGQLFDAYQTQSAEQQSALVVISLPPLLFAVPVILIFFWWAAGALVKYTRWQLVHAQQWRFFWMAILLFLAIVEFDPLDRIHPEMSRKGLAAAPNLVEIIGNGLFNANGQLRPPDELFFQFQWGYFLLWFLFWFLVITAHWSYIGDGLREAWFYARRFQRYGVSVLLGFRETARLARTAPVTRDYPRERPALPPAYRGIPRLNGPALTSDEARAILAADTSGAFSSPPGQPQVLFVDLGVYDFSPALAGLRRSDGSPLLTFSDYWPLPETRREDLVVPLGRPGRSFSGTTLLEQEEAGP